MSLEANKELVRRLFEEDLNGDNRDVADSIFAVDFVDHTNPPQWKHGLDGHKAVVSYFKQAFPDCRWTIIEMIAEGDKVVARVFYMGTHTGDFFGIPATGKQINVPGTHVLRIANGRVAEHWGNDDDLGLMRQLGVVSAMS